MNHQSNAVLKGDPCAKAARMDTVLEAAAFKAAQITGRMAMTRASLRGIRSKLESVLEGKSQEGEEATCGVAGQIGTPPPLMCELDHQMKILDEIGAELDALRSIV